MRVFSLLLDGLDHRLVEKWNLKELKQARHGVYEALICPKYRQPYTPQVWASFITGKNVEVDDWWTYGKVLDQIINALKKIPWIRGKGWILRKLGIKKRVVNKMDLRTKTIFDVVKPSIALFIPAYNEPSGFHYELNEALSKGLKEYEEKIWEIHYRRVKETLKQIRGDWLLFMAWFDLADLLGHIHIAKRPPKLWKAYLALDILATIIRENLPEDTLLLIVSDHGIEATGDHSRYGFYSINRDLEFFKPKKITDFYDLIMHAIKLG